MGKRKQNFKLHESFIMFIVWVVLLMFSTTVGVVIYEYINNSIDEKTILGEKNVRVS
jgi:hypothetical protein